mmetsp:Transcript_30746/g.81773  ORF Transcript_30746/g.81773 Transcript_30746/m.81773 type:complete len:114 (+) Transcript_30746:403-744(+)
MCNARRTPFPVHPFASGFPGAVITPHYDSLLVKVTSRATTRLDAAIKLQRALREFRVRGVTTNKSFLLNVLRHPDFLHKHVTTSFIGQNPDLLEKTQSKDRAQKVTGTEFRKN